MQYRRCQNGQDLQLHDLSCTQKAYCTPLWCGYHLLHLLQICHDLKADLAVLSACESARGRIGAGEGVIGLAWALFVAGCPTTVVSQWKVESSSTAELMLSFHRNLKSGMSKSEALRASALKVMADKRCSHPFYWAGFIVIGDGN